MELRVQPIDRTLTAEPGATLLDVLLEAQVPVSYSCMSGRCGVCRCKVLKGRVNDGRSTGLPRRINESAYVLACQSVLGEDLEIEIPEPDEVVQHPARTIKATVVDKQQLGADVLILRLKPAKPLAFSPGQYANLQFRPGLERPYSMAGLPGDALMEFHIRVVPGGRVSTLVRDELTVGDSIKLSGPLGAAYLRRKHAGPTLCVASGTGMAPVISIIRGAMTEGLANPIRVYYAATRVEDMYALDTLRTLQARHGRMELVPVVMAREVPAGFRSGLVTEAIAADFSKLNDWNAYLCGNPAMVEATASLVEQLGIAPQKIHADAFYPSH